MYKGNSNYNYKNSSMQRTSIVVPNEKYKRIIIERRESKSYYSIDFFLEGYDDSDAYDFIALLSRKETLEFVHEYRNIYDTNKIAVYSKDHVKLGYVPKVMGSFFAQKLKNNSGVRAYIKNINNSSDIPTELRIEVRVIVSK